MGHEMMRHSDKKNTGVRGRDHAGGNGEDKEFLRTEPLGKLLLKLALPTVTQLKML